MARAVQSVRAGRLLALALVTASAALTPVAPVAPFTAAFARFLTGCRSLTWPWHIATARGSGHSGLVGHRKVLLGSVAWRALGPVTALRPVATGAPPIASTVATSAFAARLSFAGVVASNIIAIFSAMLGRLPLGTLGTLLAFRSHAIGARFRVALAAFARTAFVAAFAAFATATTAATTTTTTTTVPAAALRALAATFGRASFTARIGWAFFFFHFLQSRCGRRCRWCFRSAEQRFDPAEQSCFG